MGPLTRAVASICKQVENDPDLEAYEPLALLLVGLARDFDRGELPAVAVQQLRQGLKELRDGLAQVTEDRASGGAVADLLARAREDASE